VIVCFKPLWKLLIDRDISIAELRQATHIAASTISKMKRNENVSLEVLVRICTVLCCQLSDIAEIQSPASIIDMNMLVHNE